MRWNPGHGIHVEQPRPRSPRAESPMSGRAPNGSHKADGLEKRHLEREALADTVALEGL
jgi:hypothetical protein